MIRPLRIPFWLELSAALLCALTLSFAATYLIIGHERDEAVRSERLTAAAFEVRHAIDFATETGAPDRRRGRGGRGARFQISDQPEVLASTAPEPMVSRFRAILAPSGVGELRLAIESGPRRADGLPPPPPGARPPLRERIIVSAELPNGRWLNGVVGLPPPPPNPLRPLIISASISALALLAVALWMGWRLSRPLHALGEASRIMRAGGAAPPVPEQGPAPVRLATEAFNAMAARVQATLDGQRALLAGLAHDLRTPITALRVRSALITDRESRERIEASLDELTALAEAALTAVRAGGDGEAIRPFDVAALAESIAADLADLGQNIAFEEGIALPVSGKVDATRRALRNLMENAVRHGGGARVRAEKHETEAWIICDDDGPGIPAADLERAFDPFVRLDPSRSAAGHGLGLTIARLIARGQGGDVVLHNRPEGGLRAVFKLPAG
jgi:signal transduction histidine kinase